MHDAELNEMQFYQLSFQVAYIYIYAKQCLSYQGQKYEIRAPINIKVTA